MLRTIWELYRVSPRPLRRALATCARLGGRIIGVFKSSVSIEAFRLSVDFSDNAAYRYWRWGKEYERDLVAVFLGAISGSPGSIVLDIGASYGFFSLSAATIGRYGAVKEVLAYEPDERSFRALSRSVQQNGLGNLVFATRTLVGDSDGTSRLFKSNQASTSNRSFQTDTAHFSYAQVEEVTCVRLDTDLARKNIVPSQNMFVIKIDVEGNEHRVLAGAGDLLSQARGLIILFEFYPTGINGAGATVENLASALRQSSWDMLALRDRGHWRRFASLEALLEEMRGLFERYKDEPQFAADCVIARNALVSHLFDSEAQESVNAPVETGSVPR